MKNQLRSSGLFRRFFIPAMLAFPLLGLSRSNAQLPQPHINFVFPQGVQKGKTIEATVSGKDLKDTKAVRITGGAVTAKVVKVENANTVRISVTVAPDAGTGKRDLRVITPAGISNRFRFFVGELPELNEKEPNSEASQAQRVESFPILINGQVFPSDRDVFRFAAKAGQTVVCQVEARSLCAYIADTVPGWLQSCLTLYDANGKELKYVDDFRVNPDPVLIYKVEKDGEYLLEIRDLIYRGRADFIYRLSVGLLPYITHVYPLGWQRNSEAQITLHGANLPTQNLKFALPGDSPPLRFVRFSHNGLNSNALPFAVGDAVEAAEAEPNDSVDKPNKVQVPVTINGRIQQRGDSDCFSFSAQKGQRLIIEVQARRLDSPLDSIITLLNATGQELREQDDTDMGDPLLTHHADSRIDYTFPAEGGYVLRIRDIQGNGGDEYAYRLLIRPPRPDFSLRTIPDNPRVANADSALITVKALRRDGFNGEIRLAAQNLPAGFVTSDAVIPAGQTQTRLTITAPAKAAAALLSPTIVGTTTIGKEAVTRKAVGAENVMQAFSLRHDVPTKEFLVAVIDSADFTLSSNIPATAVREARQESQVQVVVKASRKGIKAAVEQAEAEKKAAEQALAKLKGESAKAKADYGTAEKAAKDAEAAAPKAKAAAAKAAAAQAAAAKAAATKRRQAKDAKKKLDDLAQKQKKAAKQALANVKKQVAAATKALQAVEKAAQEAEMAAAKAKAAADKARATQVAAEKVAAEKRKLANEAKAKQDKLAKDEKAANTKSAQAKKKVDAAKAKAKLEIKLTADALPRGITFKPVSIPGDKSEATVTLSVTKQAAVGLRHNIIITGTTGTGTNTAIHVAPAIPIKVLVSAATLAKAAATKRKQANDAKKKLDDLVQKQQKSAETKLAVAAKAVTDATTAKAAMDKALAGAKVATSKSQQAYQTAEKAAKEAEAKSKAISKDAKKSADEKKKVAAAAAAKRKAANAAKTALTQAEKKQQQAQSQANTAAKNLSQAEAKKKAAEQALANIKNQVAAATKAYQAADKAAKEAEAEAAKAKA